MTLCSAAIRSFTANFWTGSINVLRFSITRAFPSTVVSTVYAAILFTTLCDFRRNVLPIRGDVSKARLTFTV